MHRLPETLDADVTPLEHAFQRHSPRLTPQGPAVMGWLIQLGVMVLWVALFVQVFFRIGVGVWSVGIAYIVYNTVLMIFVFWQTLPMLRAPISTATAPASAQPRLAVLIAAYNEAAALPGTLRGLLAQTDPPEQIIIADDGSTDATVTMLEAEFGLSAPTPGVLSEPSTKHPSLRLLRRPHGGKAKALNAAMLVADTDLVVTMDADTSPAPAAIGAIRQAFAETPELVVAGGVVIPVCGTTLRNKTFQWFQTYEYLRNFITRYAWTRTESLLLISGAFAGFRREAVVTVGGFDPDCLVEDYELIHRLQRYGRDNELGWRVRLVGNAIARTDAPGAVSDFLRQRRRWFGGFLQTQYWYRDMVGNPRYGWLGTVMLPVKAADTMEPIYGLSALILVFVLVGSGRAGLLLHVGGIVLAKTILDLVNYVWTLQLYRRWTGLTGTTNIGAALLSALLEPFTFAPLRHVAAMLGWWQFVSGRQTWTPQRRTRFADL